MQRNTIKTPPSKVTELIYYLKLKINQGSIKQGNPESVLHVHFLVFGSRLFLQKRVERKVSK